MSEVDAGEGVRAAGSIGVMKEGDCLYRSESEGGDERK